MINIYQEKYTVKFDRLSSELTKSVILLCYSDAIHTRPFTTVVD